MLLAIHDQFRAVSNQLVALADAHADAAAIATLFVPLAQVLHHHHHAEEAMVFPVMLRQTGTAPDHLQADHDEMTAAIGEVVHVLRTRTGELADAVRRFHDILIAHLDREEKLVVPMFLALSPREAWDLIHGAR
jgi:iron-sulfur cluster repair protein YtfE (RIC family)